MTALFGLARRNWLISNPPEAPKSAKPLRFGVLSAADIAPQALIVPAKSHPEVVIQSVACRDPSRAKAFAQKHGIPEVAGSYQDILDNPNIDCVYIPLPNGLHLKWALRALEAGKHVLLEKPSVGNAAEARTLFRSPLLACGGPHRTRPVVLEAAHFLFHPAWSTFMSYVSPADVESARADLWVPRWKIGNDDIRYRYDLAGGALMDLGCYTATALSRIFGCAAEECVECKTEPGPQDPRCDRLFKARYRFPGGRERFGEMEGDFKAPLDRISPDVHVVHRPVSVRDDLDADITTDVERAGGWNQVEVWRTRKIKFSTFLQPAYMHSIEVEDEYEMRKSRAVSPAAPVAVLKTWKKSKTSTKAYTFRNAGVEQPGEPYWATYRYQLEQFVNRVRGRETKQWFDGEDSINTMSMIDMAYAAARLPLRVSEVDKKMEEKLERTESKLDKAVERKVDKKPEQKLDRNAGQKLEQVEQKLDRRVEPKLDKKAEQRLDTRDEQVVNKMAELGLATRGELKFEKKPEQKLDKKVDQKLEKPMTKFDTGTEQKLGKKTEQILVKKTEQRPEKRAEQKANEKVEKLDKQPEKNLNRRIDQVLDKKVEQKLDKRVEQALEKKSEQRLDRRVEQGLDKKVEPKLDNKVEQRLEKKVEQKLDKRVEQVLDKNVEQKPDKRVEQRLEKKIEQKPDKKVEQRLDNKKAEQKLDNRVEQGLEKKSEQRLDKRVEQRLDKKLEQKLDNRVEQKLEKMSEQRLDKKAEQRLDNKKAEQKLDNKKAEQKLDNKKVEQRLDNKRTEQRLDKRAEQKW